MVLQQLMKAVHVPSVNRRRSKIAAGVFCTLGLISAFSPGSGADGSAASSTGVTITPLSFCAADRQSERADIAASVSLRIANSQWLCVSQESRWSSMYLHSGFTYTIDTINLSAYGDTMLKLFSPDGATMLAADDDGGAERGESRLTFTVETSEVYLINISRAHAASTADPLHYDLKIN